MGLLGTVFGKTRVNFIQNNSTIIQFDASIKESHTRKSEPTQFPVENGQTISDHIIVKPFALELQGIISDSPIGGLGGLIQEAITTVTASLLPPLGIVGQGAAFALFSSLAGSSKPSVAAYGQLLQLQAAGLPFTILTSLFRYDNMWISDISVPREAESGNALIFTVQAVQLLLVSPQSVNISIFANPALAASQADLGQQSVGISSFAQGVKSGVSDAQNTVNSLVGGH